MTSAVEQFLGRLHRTLSGRAGSGNLATATSESFHVTAIDDPFAKKQLGHCFLEKRIGSGAMSIVYKARQDVTERVVAVKILRSQLACVPTNVKRFQREAKAISRLSHENLLNVYDVGSTTSGQPYMVMDFIEGKSLAEIIAAEGYVRWQRAANIFLQACSAMQHAHEHNIIHRDLKPDNIMLVNTADGADLVKVVDFGIVKLTDESQALSQRLTQTGEVWGSPVYMSPEQCAGRDIDARTDIYSLGTVMYEVLTGAQVFTGKRITEIIMKQLNEKPQPPGTLRPDLMIPGWLEHVVLRALEKEPAQRWQSMAEVKKALIEGKQESSQITEEVRMPAVQQVVDPFVNRRLADKYLIKSVIGEGGMSVVYEAIQEGVHRRVAIKVLKQELVEEQAQIQRFLREARAISQLSHPNLVAVYDLGTAPTGQPYMVLEYLEGVSLSSIIDDIGAVPGERLLPIFIQVCDVMEHAHRQGIIHRDLKPSNIMIVNNAASKDLVKVVDFGILKYDAALHGHSQKITKTGDICGSPIYMSPEQILDQPLDARTDVYSLGVVLYEAITGSYLFSGTRITDILEKHVNVLPTSFDKLRPELHLEPMLEVAVFKALEKLPKDRFQSMSEMKEALATIHRRLYKSPLPSSAGLSPLPSEAQASRRAAASELQTLSKPSSEIDRHTMRACNDSPPSGVSSGSGKPSGVTSGGAKISGANSAASPIGLTQKSASFGGSALSGGRILTQKDNSGNSDMQKAIPLPVIAGGAMALGIALAFAVFMAFFNKPAVTTVKPSSKNSAKSVMTLQPSAVTGAATKAEPPVQLQTKKMPSVAKHVPAKKRSPHPHHNESLMEEINAAEDAFVKHKR